MNLSILIPSYNRDCSPLVQDLLEQLPEDAEIIVGNDRSTSQDAINAYQRISSMKHCRVYEPMENLGRSRLCNRLFDLSSGKWILILDCDLKVESSRFIDNYLQATKDFPADIYYGGMKNTKQCPQGCELRWTYESETAERLTQEYREQHPFESLTTQNIMIRRDAFAQTGFEENITQYGYEDIVLLYHLQQKGKTICHLENRLVHMDMDTNKKFLKKTRQALRTLHAMKEEERPQTPLIMAHKKLKKYYLHRILAIIHILLHPITHRILCSKHVSIWLFQLYKLGYFCSL